MNKKMNQAFHITSVCREDIITMLVDAKNLSEEKAEILALSISDDHMKQIASKLADGFMDGQSFWESLEDIYDNIFYDHFHYCTECDNEVILRQVNGEEGQIEYECPKCKAIYPELPE
jgi:hypothetical protein